MPPQNESDLTKPVNAHGLNWTIVILGITGLGAGYMFLAEGGFPSLIQGKNALRGAVIETTCLLLFGAAMSMIFLLLKRGPKNIATQQITLLIVTALILSASLAHKYIRRTGFDKNSCCDKAAAIGKPCAHPCCIEATLKNKICVQCNPKSASN